LKVTFFAGSFRVFKKETEEKLFYPNGEKKKIVANILYKVMWFNYVHQKFSE